MYKRFFVFLCFAACILLTACSQTAAQAPSVSPHAVAEQTHPSTSAVSMPPAATQTATAAPSQAVLSTQAAASSMAPSAQSEPSNSAEMYSSYAHMATFDPKTGWAEFDYFDMLRGDAAVNWLVENKGYTRASAQAEVSQYADSEYIEKNTNPQLRTVDLNKVILTLMYTPDGTPVDGPDPVSSTVDDLRALYANDPSLILQSYFYYVEVKDGKAVEVDQVYWP